MNNDAVRQLNSVQYIFLRELSEPRDNSLRLVVKEAVKNERGVPKLKPTPELQKLLENGYPIESVEACRKFEIY